MSLTRLHFGVTLLALVLVGLAELGGVYRTDGSSPRVDPTVRENPSSYRPVYVPLGRSSGSGGSSGGWGSGK